MLNLSLMKPAQSYSLPALLVPLIGLLCLTACQPSPEPDAETTPEATLQPTDSPEAIAAYLLDLRARHASSRALAQHFPNLDRPTAYQIQRLTLAQQVTDGAEQIGWKMGGTRLTTPDAEPDPVYGYSLASHRYEDGAQLEDSLFANGTPLVEAEIAFWIGEDLPGPTVSREALIEALDGVGGAVELISQRMQPAAEGGTLPLAHAIADNLSHGGVILGTTRVPLAEIDLNQEAAWIEIDGVEQARGEASAMMEGDLLAAILWLANELPKHGQSLHAGDFVIPGSLYDNPTLQAGQQAEVHFTTLGTIRLGLR